MIGNTGERKGQKSSRQHVIPMANTESKRALMNSDGKPGDKVGGREKRVREVRRSGWGEWCPAKLGFSGPQPCG